VHTLRFVDEKRLLCRQEKNLVRQKETHLLTERGETLGAQECERFDLLRAETFSVDARNAWN